MAAATGGSKSAMDGCVTYRWLFGTALTVCTLLMTIGAFAWHEHNRRIHDGAVNVQQYHRDQQKRDTEIVRILNKLDNLENKFDKRFDQLSDKVDDLLRKGS